MRKQDRRGQARERCRRALERLRRDPVAFARAVLGLEPWHMQEEVLRALASRRRVAVAGGHAVGKDHVAAAAMLWFLCTRERSVVLSTAPTARQVRMLLWGELRRQWASSRIPLGGRLSATSLVLGPGWYALGFSTDAAERFQGFHARSMLVVIDEAAGVERGIHEAADTVLTGEESSLLLIGNPTSREGRFFEAFADPSFATLRIPCTAHPNVVSGENLIPGAVTREWVEHVRRAYGEESAFWRSRVLAEFPSDDSAALLERSWIERALSTSIQAGSERSIGVDVARFGNDSTVICAAQGGEVLRLYSARRRDLYEVARMVDDEIRALEVDPARVFVDDTGLGGGVTDILRSRGYAVRPERFGARASRPESFANRRSELFWGLRRLFEAGLVGLARVASSRDGKILAEQLSLLRVLYTPDGRIVCAGSPGELASPSTSPDHADALALALAPAGPAGAEPGRSGIWLGG